MAKTIVTRIKNKVDSISNWNSATGKLLDGEIAIVRVPTGQTYNNPVTGKSEPVVELLMKVGDGVHTFNEVDENGNPYLPWLSAKASDVYDWAKTASAEAVPFTMTDGTSTTSGKTLRDLLELINGRVLTNSANISDLSGKVDVEKVSTAISKAIGTFEEGLVHAGTKGTNEIVKAVTQADGKVTVTYGTIIAEELPEITTSMIKTGDATLSTLDAKLYDMDSKIASFKSGISHDYNNTTGNYVKNVAYDSATGKITVTKGSIALTDVPAVDADRIQANAVTTDKIVDGNVTDAKIDSVSASKVIYTVASGNTQAVTLPAKIADVEAQIAGINTAIAGGVHFIGTTDTEPTTETIDGKTVINGDVVIYDGKEYIYVKPEGQPGKWEQLGDITRLGELENKVKALNTTDTNVVATTHKFVSQVTQSEGQIAVTYAQPTSADISHDNTTVKATLENHASWISSNAAAIETLNGDDAVPGSVAKTVKDAIDALDLVSDPTSSGEAADTENFVTQVRQTNGNVSYSRKTLPVATTAKKGITTLGASGGAATYARAEEIAGVATENKSAISTKCLQFTTSGDNVTLKLGDSTEEIIFDCGGAPTA